MSIKINYREFSSDELKVIAAESLDRTNFASKLGFTYLNGRVSKKLSEIINEFNLSVSHFDSTRKQKASRKYQVIKKICPVCDKEFDTQIGSKEERTTCSYSCSNVLYSSDRHSEEANNKRARVLQKDKIEKKCLICDKTFCVLPSRNRKEYCSVDCATIFRSNNRETKDKLSMAIRARIANGTHKGWSSRTKLEPSYAEKYTIKLLNELNIVYDREVKINKWFIDFADKDRKLALEIDGRQHNFPERKASDENKDKYLIDNGWKVLRIKWKKIDKEFREFIINSLIEFFRV